jgi:hypothetical protein
MQITRRRFVSWLGASTVLGGASLAYGAATPAEALSTILRDSKPKTDKEKAAHGTAEAQPKNAATEHKRLTTAEELWVDLIEGNPGLSPASPRRGPWSQHASSWPTASIRR